MRAICFIVVVILILSVATKVSAQTDPLTVSMSVQNWNSQMKSLNPPETTPDIGLVLEIDVKNGDNHYTAAIPSFTIQYQLVDETGQPPSNPASGYQAQPIVIPNGTVSTFYVPVMIPSSNIPYGDYSLTVTYSCSNYIQWIGPPTGSTPQSLLCASGTTNLEPYPLDFKVVSDSSLQTDIQNLKSGTGMPVVNIGPIVLGGGGTTGLITAALVVIGAVITLVTIYLKRKS